MKLGLPFRERRKASCVIGAGILFTFTFSACSPLLTPATTQQPSATSTLPPAAAIATETPAPGPTPWPTYQAPTLAPFPLNGEELAPNPLPISSGGFPPSMAAPLALSEHDHFYFTKPIANADY